MDFFNRNSLFYAITWRDLFLEEHLPVSGVIGRCYGGQHVLDLLQ